MFTINALRGTKQSNAVYSHIFKNISKNKLNYSYISSIMCVLCEKAQLTKILKPEKIKYFRQKFGFEQNSKLNERNKCLNYNNLKKISFPYSMPTLNSHKKIVSRKKTFDSKYLKISLNKIKNLISEKCDYSSYVKQIQKNIKKPVNTYCRTYKLRALTESLISKKMYFAPICSLPTKAIFKDYSFIIPEILDKSEKTVKVKMRLLPYPFGFPNFIHIKDKYVFFKSKKDFELKCNLDCKKQIFKNFNIYKEKKYRSPLSLREPRRFMFSKPGYSIFGSEIFVCDKQTNKQLFQNKVSKFKFYWQSKHYVISKVFGSLSPFTFRNRIRGQKTNFKIIDYKITSQSFYTNKPADMSKVKSSKICNFMISNIKYKAKNQNGAYSVANKPYSNESFGIKGIKKLSLLKFQAKTTKFDLNVNKDYYLDILNPDKIHKKESVLFKATYRTFLAPYKATEYKNKELEEKRENIIEKHIYDINMFKSVINSFNFEIINKLEFKYKNYSDISFQSNYYTIFKFAAKYKWDNEQYKDIQCSNSSLEFNDSKILPLKYIDASKINYCLKSCFRSKTKSIKFSTEINRQLINYNSIKKLSTVPQIKTTKIKTFKQDCKHINIKENVDFHIDFIASETKPLNIFISSFNLYKNAYVSINLNKINQKMNQKVVELHNKFDTELESEFKNLAYKTNLDKVSNIKANSFAEKISDFRQSYHEPGIPDWIDIDLISRRNIRLLSLHS